MSTAITTIQPYSPNLANIGRITPSFISLIQNTTEEKGGGKPGQYINNDTGELYDTLTIVELNQVENRFYYPPGSSFRGNPKPLCKSDDGIVPSKFVETPQSPLCATCGKAEWTVTPEFPNGKPSECKSTRKLLVAIKGSSLAGESEGQRPLPYSIVVKGKSVSPYNKQMKDIEKHLISINAPLYREALKTKVMPVYFGRHDYFLTIGSTQVGGYFVMTFSGVTRFKTPGEFAADYEKYVKQAAGITETDEADAAINNVVHEI